MAKRIGVISIGNINENKSSVAAYQWNEINGGVNVNGENGENESEISMKRQ
jgi:hypothetical protein